MKSFTRKITVFIASVCAMIFAFCALVSMNMVLEGLLLYVLVLLPPMILCILITVLMNSIHDEISLKTWKSRYAANTLFFTLILMVMDSLLYLLETRHFSDSKAVLYEFCYAFAVVMATQMYRRNYPRLFPEKERVRVLSETNVRYHGRRSTMLVMEATKNGRYYDCVGVIDGHFRDFDKLYAYQPDGTVQTVRIRAMFEKEERENPYTVRIICSHKPPVFTVLSNARTGFREFPESFAENPRLAGLVTGFRQNFKDTAYLSALANAFLNAKMIVPARLPGRQGCITESMPPNTNVSVPAITRLDKADDKLLPVFTDWEALSRWEAFLEHGDTGTMVVTYDRMMELYEGNYEGIVINPFSPYPLFMDHNLLALMKKVQVAAKQMK